MAIIDPALGVKLVYLLGITNIIGFLLIFFSCRCVGGIGSFSGLLSKKWFNRFYNYHCYYWWFFAISVLLHTALAFIVFGSAF